MLCVQTSMMRELVMREAGPCLTPGSTHASTGLGGTAVRTEMWLRVMPLPAPPRPQAAGEGGAARAAALQPVLGALPEPGSASVGGLHCSLEVLRTGLVGTPLGWWAEERAV